MTEVYQVHVYRIVNSSLHEDSREAAWAARLGTGYSAEEQRELNLEFNTRYDFFTPEHAHEATKTALDHRGSADSLRGKLNQLLLASSKTRKKQ